MKVEITPGAMENLFASASFVGDSTNVVRIEAKTDEAARICALCSLGKTFCDRSLQTATKPLGL